MTQAIQAREWAPQGTDIRTPEAFTLSSLVNRQETQPSTVFPFVKPSSRLIQQLRRQSGLNWTKLAELANVDRRTLHNWANGKDVSSENLKHLQKVTKILMDNGSRFPRENRKALLSEADGDRVIDLLRLKSYEAAALSLKSLLGTEMNEPSSEAEVVKPSHLESRSLVDRLTADEAFDQGNADIPISEGEWLPWGD